jgi:hypothetical protein
MGASLQKALRRALLTLEALDRGSPRATPTTSSPRSDATLMAYAERPCTKLVVPSSGSIIQVNSP